MTKVKVHYLFVAFSWTAEEAWHFRMECESEQKATYEDVLDLALDIFEANFSEAEYGYCVFDARNGQLICIVNSKRESRTPCTADKF